MESSTLCKDAKQEHKGKCSNPSLPNPTKATNAMEELERKNKGGGQPMNPRSRSNEFPSLRGGIDWWSCRSRSPLPNPSKNARIIGGKREGASSRGAQEHTRNPRKPLGKKALL
jgi:hypothetical protein